MQIRLEDGSRRGGHCLMPPPLSIPGGPDTSGRGKEKSSGETSSFISDAELVQEAVCVRANRRQ